MSLGQSAKGGKDREMVSHHLSAESVMRPLGFPLKACAIRERKELVGLV